MPHVLDFSKLRRIRRGDIDHLVVTCNCGDIHVVLAGDEKAALSQGLRRADVCHRRNYPKYRLPRLAYIEHGFLLTVTKVHELSMVAERTNEIKRAVRCQRHAHYQLDASRIRNVKGR